MTLTNGDIFSHVLESTAGNERASGPWRARHSNGRHRSRRGMVVLNANVERWNPCPSWCGRRCAPSATLNALELGCDTMVRSMVQRMCWLTGCSWGRVRAALDVAKGCGYLCGLPRHGRLLFADQGYHLQGSCCQQGACFVFALEAALAPSFGSGRDGCVLSRC
jgi:hypothetical protein